MKEIQMVDLRSQYEKIKPEIDAAIQEVINSSAFINGPAVKKFENELAAYAGCSHVIACANGTDALQVACMALDLKPGDEVITTTFTFVSTVEILCLLGLKPVLVDVDAKTFNMDVSQVEKKITPKTKAIIPVHLYGQGADMEGIMALAQKHNLYVIEDTAQAIGAEYQFSNGSVKKTGTIGNIGTTSFFPSKNLGGYGDGGALLTNDDELAYKLRGIVNHGQKMRYEYEMIGVNSRLDTIQAAILRVKLRHLDEYAGARRKAAEYYDRAFQSIRQIKTPYRSSTSSHVFHQYTITVEGIDRDHLKEFLSQRGIPAMVYYPKPLHAHDAYKPLGYSDKDFPVAVDLSKRVLSLPMHTELDEEQLEHITRSVIDFVKSKI
ncbi:MAG TPA: DegT/DnrJ/EryC1/StrS family aminotransferase [Chitinophagales bacterium]|nr:DegT/DnrJ/EryC1/StrS family aminotransferase [Chitinophagales bacterium]